MSSQRTVQHGGISLAAGFLVLITIYTTSNALHLKCAPEPTELFHCIISLGPSIGKGK